MPGERTRYFFFSKEGSNVINTVFSINACLDLLGQLHGDGESRVKSSRGSSALLLLAES